jgi:hypothetical protein
MNSAAMMFEVGDPVEARISGRKGVVVGIDGDLFRVRLTSPVERSGVKFASLAFPGAALKPWHPVRKSLIPRPGPAARRRALNGIG